MFSNISSTTLQSWRERPPSSYSIKVKNLSELQSSTLYSDGKYQSRRFSSGDYKWRLIIYPKGNEKDNGSGYISMYVEIDSTSLITTTPAEVYADLRFFVFNKKENKYFTIQDVESKPFNTLRTMWGISRVLPLDTFNDGKNGYHFDGGHCEFGVDIIVAPPPTKWEIISFADGEILKEDEKVHVKAQLKVEDPHGSNHFSYELNLWLKEQGTGHGWDRLVSIDELRKSYLDKEDTLKIEIEFKVVSVTKYSSFN